MTSPRSLARWLGINIAAHALAIATSACDTLASDCEDFCERVNECVESNLSVDDCKTACTNWADDDNERESKVEHCSDCLSESDTCSEATRRCTSDCVGIPVQRKD